MAGTSTSPCRGIRWETLAPLFSSQPTWVADRPLIDIIIPNVSKYSRRQIMNPFSAAAGELIYLSTARLWHLTMFFLFVFFSFLLGGGSSLSLGSEMRTCTFFLCCLSTAFFSLGVLIPSECDFKQEGGRESKSLVSGNMLGQVLIGFCTAERALGFASFLENRSC